MAGTCCAGFFGATAGGCAEVPTHFVTYDDVVGGESDEDMRLGTVAVPVCGRHLVQVAGSFGLQADFGIVELHELDRLRAESQLPVYVAATRAEAS